MRLLIVTGMSGAGKSAVIRAMEDMGMYCVDNMPAGLIIRFAQLYRQPGNTQQLAVVVDSRNREMFYELFDALASLEQEGIPYQLLFLDASDEELIHRYKITRRRHPLLGERYATLSQAIAAERQLLARAREQATYILDTTLLSEGQLKEQIAGMFPEYREQRLMINCISFGFKFGLPPDADLVFDVRCLPNPFYDPQLRPMTGLDREVQEFVLSSPMTQGLLERLYALIEYLLPLYEEEEHKSQLTIAIGCTGGKHRSVTLTGELERRLRQQGYQVLSTHRDIGKKKL